MAGGIVLWEIWRLFAGLPVSSFWQDEIFSMRLAEQPTFTAMLARAVQDTHPPTFYSLLWGWVRMAGFDEPSARLLSVVFSIGLIAVLLALPRPGTAALPRLLVAAAVVTSPFWGEHAAEVRSYAMVSFLLAAAALSSSRAVAARTAPAASSTWGLSFCASVTVASATHLFALYASAWMCIALVVARPDAWRLALAGLACTTLAGLAYAAQIALFHDFGVSGMIFAPSVSFLAASVQNGLRAGGRPAMLMLALVCLIAGGLALFGKRKAPRRDYAPLLHDLALLCGPVAVTLAGLVVTLVVPSMNYRGPQVGLVLGWSGLIGLLDTLLRQWPRVMAAGGLAAILATIIELTTWQQARPLPAKQDFRSLARHLASFKACTNATIPVLRNVEEVPDFARSQGEGLRQLMQDRLGYYERASWHDYRAFVILHGRYVHGWAPRELLSARIAGVDPCPVLAVVADIRTYPPQVIEKAMRDAVSANGGDPGRLTVRWFPHHGGGRPGRIVRQVAVFSLSSP